MSQRISSLGKLQSRWPVLQLVALAVLFLYGSLTIDGFSGEESLRSMLVLAALLGLAAAGQTLCVLIGALDLSVPGLIVLGATVVSELYGAKGWPFLPALAVVVIICAVAGASVGFICHRYRIAPLIVTLATGTLALGAIQVWTGSQLSGSTPAFVSKLVAADGTTFGLPLSPIVVVWALFAVLLGVVLHRRVAGRRLYATGANPRAAELALVRTRNVWIGVFMTSAVLSGLVGILLAGFSGADLSLGDQLPFSGPDRSRRRR